MGKCELTQQSWEKWITQYQWEKPELNRIYSSESPNVLTAAYTSGKVSEPKNRTVQEPKKQLENDITTVENYLQFLMKLNIHHPILKTNQCICPQEDAQECLQQWIDSY